MLQKALSLHLTNKTWKAFETWYDLGVQLKQKLVIRILQKVWSWIQNTKILGIYKYLAISIEFPIPFLALDGADY